MDVINKNEITFWKAQIYNIILYFKIGFPILILLLIFTSADIIEAYVISFIIKDIIIIIFPIPFYHYRKGKYYLTKSTFKHTIIVLFFLSVIIISLLIFKG